MRIDYLPSAVSCCNKGPSNYMHDETRPVSITFFYPIVHCVFVYHNDIRADDKCQACRSCSVTVAWRTSAQQPPAALLQSLCRTVFTSAQTVFLSHNSIYGISSFANKNKHLEACSGKRYIKALPSIVAFPHCCLFVQKKAKVQEIFSAICERLSLHETEFFGLARLLGECCQ